MARLAARHLVPRMAARGGGYRQHLGRGLLSQVGSALLCGGDQARGGRAGRVAVDHPRRRRHQGLIVVPKRCVQRRPPEIRWHRLEVDGMREPEDAAEACVQAIEAETFLGAAPAGRSTTCAARPTTTTRWLGMRKLNRKFSGRALANPPRRRGVSCGGGGVAAARASCYAWRMDGRGGARISRRKLRREDVAAGGRSGQGLRGGRLEDSAFAVSIRWGLRHLDFLLPRREAGGPWWTAPTLHGRRPSRDLRARRLVRGAQDRDPPGLLDRCADQSSGPLALILATVGEFGRCVRVSARRRAVTRPEQCCRALTASRSISLGEGLKYVRRDRRPACAARCLAWLRKGMAISPVEVRAIRPPQPPSATTSASAASAASATSWRGLIRKAIWAAVAVRMKYSPTPVQEIATRPSAQTWRRRSGCRRRGRRAFPLVPPGRGGGR